MTDRDFFVAGCFINDKIPKIILASRLGNIYLIDKVTENLNVNIGDEDLKRILQVSGHVRLIKPLTNDSILIGLWSGEIFKFSFSTKILKP